MLYAVSILFACALVYCLRTKRASPSRRRKQPPNLQSSYLSRSLGHDNASWMKAAHPDVRSWRIASTAGAMNGSPSATANPRTSVQLVSNATGGSGSTDNVQVTLVHQNAGAWSPSSTHTSSSNESEDSSTSSFDLLHSGELQSSTDRGAIPVLTHVYPRISQVSWYACTYRIRTRQHVIVHVVLYS